MRAIAVAFLLLALATPSVAQERNWQIVRDDKGMYAAQLPGKAESYSDKTAIGEASGHHVELDNGAQYFDVYWIDVPKAPQERNTQAAFIKTRVEETVAAAKGAILSYRPLALGSFVGGEAVIDFPSMGGRLRQRHFMVGQRMVQQTWSGSPGGETATDVEKFFDSLKLKP